MDIYFVRHGQTDGNVARRHQHQDTPLNDIGIAEARAVAADIALLKPTHLMTSTFTRALMTAREIGLACQLIPETHPAFVEFRRPDFFVGERLVGLVTLRYMIQWFFGVPSAAMHDGEGYAAFLQRLISARQYLESLPSDARVVIVSHSIFINFFIAHMNNPAPLSLWRAGIWFVRILILKNASITHVRYVSKFQGTPRAWRVR